MRKILCDLSGREIIDEGQVVKITVTQGGTPKQKPLEIDAITFYRIAGFIETNKDWDLPQAPMES